MTPKQAAKAFWEMNDFCKDETNRKIILSHKCGQMNIPDHSVLNEKAEKKFANMSMAIANAQKEFDAYQWTEYSQEFQRISAIQ